jgi:hypothetical protein
MKTTKLTLALAGLMIASAAIVSSCKKKEATSTPDTNATSASDNTMAEKQSNDAENIGAQANENGSLSTFRLAGGGASPMGVGSVTGFGTGTVTVTFHDSLGADGHTRNGTIVFSVSPAGAHYRDSGMVMTISTPGNTYYVDGNQVEITKTITNNGRIASGNNMQWTIHSNITINKAGGGTVTWTANRTHTLLNTGAVSTYNGMSVPTAYNGTSLPISWNVAIIQINGSSSGTSADGVTFTASSNNVVRNMNCAPITSRPHFHPFCAGTIDFNPAGKTTRVLNFGTGNCSTTYTISIGSWSETVNW